MELEIEQEGNLIKDVRNDRRLVESVAKNMDFIGEHHIPRTLNQGIGSTDVGNVSHICPTIFVEVGLDGFYGHTEEALALADDKAYPVLHSTVRVLTQAALQAASDSNLRENLWTQWRERI